MLGFRATLAKRQRNARTLVSVGLDPLPEKLPECMRGLTGSLAGDIGEWMCRIAVATAPFASMFKPQSAHWEAIPGGYEELGRMVEAIHRMVPDVPVLDDVKRGDIDRTQGRYRVAHFDRQHADGANFSPYMGKDCMAGLVDGDHLGRALVGLCYTTNKSARQVQDVRVIGPDGVTRCYWECIAQWTLEWAQELGVVEDAGLVMAAAYENPRGSGTIYSQHLVRYREIVGDKLWFLVPGIGAQKGFVAETVRAGYVGPGSMAISSSSAIDFASTRDDFAEAAAAETQKLRDTINGAL